MEASQNTLVTLLLQNSKYVTSKGELFTQKVIEDLENNNKELIEYLYSSPQIKSDFFKEIGKISIFLKDDCIKQLKDIRFLGNSYTRYNNKIGLLDKSTNYLLSEKADVVLNFPYKDCTLEGGMTKEEKKYNEVMLNEVLAKKDLTTLLSPKVLTNFIFCNENGFSPLTSNISGGVSNLFPIATY